MKARDTQGSFITLISTLIAKVKEITDAPIVTISPRADMAADLFLRPMVSQSIHRELVEEARLNPMEAPRDAGKTGKRCSYHPFFSTTYPGTENSPTLYLGSIDCRFELAHCAPHERQSEAVGSALSDVQTAEQAHALPLPPADQCTASEAASKVAADEAGRWRAQPSPTD